MGHFRSAQRFVKRKEHRGARQRWPVVRSLAVFAARDDGRVCSSTSPVERYRREICYNLPPETMCGIVGYVGNAEAAPILLDGLRRLEYRGYDSAGVAIVNRGHLETRKCAGRIVALTRLITKQPLSGSF